MNISTEQAVRQQFAAAAGPGTFAFNHKELVKMLSDNPSANKVVFSQLNCQIPGAGMADFLFAQVFKGNELLGPTDPPDGCPYPPGWQQFALGITGDMLNNQHKFTVGVPALKGLLDTNAFITGDEPTQQVLARIESRGLPPGISQVLSIKNLDEGGHLVGTGNIDAAAI